MGVISQKNYPHEGERDRLPFFVVCLLCSMIAEPAEKVNESFFFFALSRAQWRFMLRYQVIFLRGWARPAAALGGVCVFDSLPVRVV